MTVYYERIPSTDPRLARHIRHDDESRRYAYDTTGLSIVSAKHTRRIPVLDQGQLGSCHDAETEILTRRGWLPFPDLTMDNELATVDPKTGELTYEKPVRVIKLSWSGDLYRVSNQMHDFAVTGDHKMLVREWDELARTLAHGYTFVPMKDLGWYVGLMVNVVQRGESRTSYTIPGVPGYKRASQREDLEVPMWAWLNFLGIYLAEGTMLRPTKKSPNKIQLAAVKRREREFVEKTMAALGVTPLALKDRYTFENARIYRHLEALGLKGVYAAEKFVPSFVFDLPADQIADFLIGHREGDGSLQNGCWTHHTSSPRLADDLHRLVLLAGGRPGVSVRQPRSSTMADGREVVGRHREYAVRHNTGSSGCIERKKDVFTEHYDGFVYCAEVPTHHTLVTRRNGKVLVSGNCTGNAGIGCLGTDPFYTDVQSEPTIRYTFDEAGAVALYGDATKLDDYPGGYYAPGWQDTGSDGLSIAKALKNAGEISGYQHTFTLDDALKALGQTPVITGVTWYEDMFNPDPDGRVHPTGSVAGGHEFVVDEIDAENKRVWFTNSWGTSWGVNGRAYLTFDDWGKMLADQGDVTIFVPLTSPAPTPTPTPTPPAPPSPGPIDDLKAIWRHFVREVEDWFKSFGG